MTIINFFKNLNNTKFGWNVEQLELSYMLVAIQHVKAHMENSLAVSYKIKLYD